ncbi:zinc finger protein 354A-like isoform X2 [Aedes albopictus]|uniref:C2H2-type domain-containing protein n=1 Tax=Aedes albopictus TaxID=7160 RepID=A0ABM1Z338_AEDAL
MQSIKIENEYISSMTALASIVQHDSTIVKIENVDDEQNNAEDYNSLHTITVKQENDKLEYDISTDANSEDASFQTKFECEETVIGIPTSETSASNSQKRHLQDNTDPNSKLSKLTFPEKCQQCSQAFGSYSDYKQHSRFHEGNRSHQCHYEGCNQTFRTSNLLLRHITVRHYRTYRCNICDQRFQFSKEYELHRSIWHPKTSSCSASKKDLSKGHKAEHFEEEDDDDESETDGSDQEESDSETEEYTNSSGTEHRLHANRHKGLKPYKCSDCGLGFARKYNRDRHVRLDGCVEMVLCCVNCDEEFDSAPKLAQHQQMNLCPGKKA